MDDERKLREYEDDGLCINIGDLVFVTGVEDSQNGQNWKEYGQLLDTSILQITADADIKIATPPLGFSQELIVLTGMASGQTVFQVEQTGPYQKPKRIDLAFYINPDRCPRRERKHHKKEEEEENFGFYKDQDQKNENEDQ